MAGRLMPSGFQTFDAMLSRVPAPFLDLFIPIPADDFRIDLSSTQLRAAAAAEKL